MAVVGKKIATVIGGQGFVGHHLVSHLMAVGWECWVPLKNDPLLTERPLGHVFYCAGLTADYAVRSFDVVDAHVSCLNKILHYSDYQSLVYLSSTRLYDSRPGILADETSDLSFNTSNPRHIYDLSKALGESMCHVAGKGKAKIARLACVYHNQNDADGFLPALLRDVIAHRNTGNPLMVNSSPYFSRDYVAIRDVVDALVKIACFGTQTIYNIASGENVKNETLFSHLASKFQIKITPLKNEQIPLPALISISRLRTEFEWQAAPVLQEIDRILENAQC